jgi:hypothetical protein
VDTPPIAESFPERYRRVLDRISELEAAGRHHEGDDVRRDAIRAYSRRWNEQTARRLDSLADRAQRLLDTPPRPRSGRRSGVMTLALISVRAPRRAVARVRASQRTPAATPPLTSKRPVS